MEERVLSICINNEPATEFIGVNHPKKRKTANTQAKVQRQQREPAKKKKEETHILETNNSGPSLETNHSGPSSSFTDVECITYQKNLEDDVTYLNLLLTQGAVTPVDEHYRAFVVQDIDNNAKCLKDDFVIIQRLATKVPDGYIWLYGCSCNPARLSMIKSISATLSEPVKEFDHPYQKCCHIGVMEKLVMKFSCDNESLEIEHKRRIMSTDCNKMDHTYERECMKTDIYGIDGYDQAVVVRNENEGSVTYSIVKVDFRGVKPVLKCSSCWKRKDLQETKCQHICAVINQQYGVSDVSQKLIETLNNKPKWRSRYIPVPLSTKKIPFSPLPEEQKMNRCNLNQMIREDGFIHLIPGDEGQCECGGEWLSETELETTQIITSTNILPAKVYIRSCGKCTQFKDYDGLEHQLLNMGVYIVAHEVLRRYLRQFITEGTPLISFYQELCWQQVESGNVEFNCNFQYNRFRYAWYGFLSLLDAEYELGFSCPQCGDCPATVVMDGVTLGLRKTFMPWKNYMKAKKQQQSLDGSSHNTRVFVNNARARFLLSKFCDEDGHLSASDYVLLKKSISLYQPSLLPFFAYFDKCNSEYKCPKVLREFFQCLCSNYPVCGFIHYNQHLFDLMQELSKGSDISSRMSDIVLIQKECPILGRVLQHFNWNTPEYLWPVFKELVEKAKYPFQCKPHDLENCSDECPCSGEGLFPKLPKMCHRGDYVLDNNNKSAESTCKKKGFSHPTLTPGIFTLSCIHGICYGFQLMEDVESPNTAYTSVRTRFQKAPKLVIYDNACNLHSYCLNRDPAFFRDTWFVVDRFHWVNHVGCHSGYNLSIYSQFNDVNTQVAEQRNATLKKLKSMLSYMNKENFVNHLKIFLWFRSMISLIKIEKNLPVKDFLLFSSLLPVFTKCK